MSMTMIPETDRNPGRKYRKHNTRLIERLRAKFPTEEWFFHRGGRYSRVFSAGNWKDYTTAEALALLNDAPTPESK